MNDRPRWHFDRAAALARLDDDEDLLRDVLEQFVADAPAALAAIQTATAHWDRDALRDAAHTLKGSAGYVAADDLCVMAQALEGFARANQFAEARAAWPSFDARAREVVAALDVAITAERTGRATT
jgi:HPt (histidine-containing phosphotransfer) domain-containing protein